MTAYGDPPGIRPARTPLGESIAGDVEAAEQLRSLQAVKIERQGFAVVDDTDRHVGLSVGQISLASDDEDAAAQIGTLAENLGFAPIKLGGLSEGGLLVQARGNSWGRLIFKDLVKFD